MLVVNVPYAYIFKKLKLNMHTQIMRNILHPMMYGRILKELQVKLKYKLLLKEILFFFLRFQTSVRLAYNYIIIYHYHSCQNNQNVRFLGYQAMCDSFSMFELLFIYSG